MGEVNASRQRAVNERHLYCGYMCVSSCLLPHASCRLLHMFYKSFFQHFYALHGKQLIKWGIPGLRGAWLILENGSWKAALEVFKCCAC